MSSNFSNEPEYVVERIKNGDAEAMSWFHRTYYVTVVYYVDHLIRHVKEAEDIVSDTFEKVWKLRGNFNDFQHMRAFLYTASRNSALDYLKYGSEYKIKTVALLGNVATEASLDISDPTILQQIVEAELLTELHTMIDQLPPMQRDVLTLLFIQGVTTQEAAQILGKDEQVIRNNKFRGLQNLRSRVIARNLLSFLLALIGWKFIHHFLSNYF